MSARVHAHVHTCVFAFFCLFVHALPCCVVLCRAAPRRAAPRLCTAPTVLQCALLCDVVPYCTVLHFTVLCARACHTMCARTCMFVRVLLWRNAPPPPCALVLTPPLYTPTHSHAQAPARLPVRKPHCLPVRLPVCPACVLMCLHRVKHVLSSTSRTHAVSLCGKFPA